MAESGRVLTPPDDHPRCPSISSRGFGQCAMLLGHRGFHVAADAPVMWNARDEVAADTPDCPECGGYDLGPDVQGYVISKHKADCSRLIAPASTPS